MLAGSVLISPLPSGSPVPGLESTPARSIPRPGAVAPLPRLRRWWPAAAALVGGSVLIDGQPLDRWNAQTLRSQIVLVAQDDSLL